MITSGRNSRITRTMSPSTAWRFQTRSVSSALLEYPKSFARVKYFDVAEHGLAVPDSQRLLGTLGISEVLRACEVLASAVHPSRGQQLLRARHAESLTELRAEQVLTAVAAREREIRRSISATSREAGDRLCVLVVRMGGDVQDAARGGEATQLLQDHDSRRWLSGLGDIRGDRRDRHAERRPERHGAKDH